MTADNASEWLDAGASHVIVTSYVFREGRLEEERLRDLVRGGDGDETRCTCGFVCCNSYVFREGRLEVEWLRDLVISASSLQSQLQQAAHACRQPRRSRRHTWERAALAGDLQFMSSCKRPPPRLLTQVSRVGKRRLVLDLSCRKKDDGKYYVVTDRWGANQFEPPVECFVDVSGAAGALALNFMLAEACCRASGLHVTL